MADTAAFASTFKALRRVLERHRGALIVHKDTPDDYQLCSPSLTDCLGRPLFVAAVRIRKHYVSFHLMPVYAAPDLVDTLSPALRKCLQGKSCFNFTTLRATHVKELTALTRHGIERFRNRSLPWA
jgi:hypothetical protein